jgi:ABC-2 type transport system permease protein
VVTSAIVTASAGEEFRSDAWAAAGRALAAGLLGAGLALPFAWVATATRSMLGTVGALVGVVALTQVVVVLGGGLWWPYAVGSLWTGMGGPAAAADVGPTHLALTAAVAPAATVAVILTWRRLTDV